MEPNIGHPVDIAPGYAVGRAWLRVVSVLTDRIGIRPILTAIIGSCPRWAVLGIHTRARA